MVKFPFCKVNLHESNEVKAYVPVGADEAAGAAAADVGEAAGNPEI
jgi:hypothetical protein